MELIGRALDPDVFKEAFNFEKRNEIINYMLGFIRAESVTEMRTEVRLQSMKALYYLVYPFFPQHPCLQFILWS